MHGRARLSVALYYFTHVWLYRNRLPGHAEDWESARGSHLVDLGIVDARGEVIYAPS